MRTSAIVGVATGVLVTAFLLLRPLAAEVDRPLTPVVSGRARHLIEAARRLAPPPAAVAGATPPKPEVVVSEREAIEDRLIALTNQERARRGLRPLERDANLRTIAGAHSRDMLVRRFVDHTNPDGQSAADRVGTSYRQLVALVGENLWSGSGLDPLSADAVATQALADLLASPSDRESLLRPSYTHLGVGIASAGRDIRVTQLFAQTYGFTEVPLPTTIARGTSLGFGLKVWESGRTCGAFDLFSPASGLRVSGPFPLAGGIIDVAPGSYKVRVICQSAGTTLIASGVPVEVR
jgi:uncharacterized protein YkwD